MDSCMINGKYRVSRWIDKTAARNDHRGSAMELLVAIEASPNSFKALERAASIIATEGGSITVATVAEMIPDLEEIFDYEELHDKLRKKSKEILETAKNYCESHSLAAKYVLLENQAPADSILEYAENNPVDLIVVGSRAKKGLDKFLLGSVALKIVSHAQCSVLVVR